MASPRVVLVVDDHPATVELVQSALESMGMEVHTASNGAECLLALSRQRPDLIILDVVMPVMDGFQTLQVLHQTPETRDIPVVMLTARSEDEDVANGWKWGAISYLTKPFAVEHLSTLVRRVLEGPEPVEVEEPVRV
ncbi:MAG: response regulator [Armatimonadota bacterium]